MARSKLDTLIYATILLAPMATALGYIAMNPAQEPMVLIGSTVPLPCPTPAVAPAPPAPVEPVKPEPPAPKAEPEPPAPKAAEPAVPLALAGAGMLMYEGQVVLKTDPDTAWAIGRIEDLGADDGIAVSRRVDLSRLPADLSALAGIAVTIYDADGVACTTSTEAASLRIHGRQQGDVVYPEPGKHELTPAQLRAARKQVFAHAQLLLADMRPDAPYCDGLWARPAALPAPAVFRRTDADDDALQERLMPALADEPAVIAMRDAYEDYRARLAKHDVEVAAWSEFFARTLVVSRWDEVGGARSFINVEIGDGGEACGSEFSEQAAVLFALDGGALIAQDDAGFLQPLAMMDLERDGHLEAVTVGGKHLESRSAATGTVQQFEIPYHGCPC